MNKNMNVTTSIPNGTEEHNPGESLVIHQEIPMRFKKSCKHSVVYEAMDPDAWVSTVYIKNEAFDADDREAGPGLQIVLSVSYL